MTISRKLAHKSVAKRIKLAQKTAIALDISAFAVYTANAGKKEAVTGSTVMIYLKRKIDTYLSEWKANSDRKPLIVKGCRQVGKTESIVRFGSKNYDNVIYINFVEEPKYKLITEDGYKTDDIVKNISRIDPSKCFVPGKTLFIFDELTEFPDIATALKFFNIDGRFDVICSGSMLGVSYKRIESNSIGYKTDYVMQSMDFEEFLWAKSYDEDYIKDLLDHMINIKPFTGLMHKMCSSHFLDFCILGGMPAVVREYIAKESFEGTYDIQKQLIADYEEDVRKYAEGLDQTRILNVLAHIAPQLAKDNKKFQISKIASGARFSDYRGCIEWLNDAGLINICYCLNFPELPLKGNYNEGKYKLYFADNGLLVAMLDGEAQEDLRVNKNLGVYKGALYENFIGEALVKEGYDLYYYKRDDSTLEQDFFVRTASKLIPVEVKARNNSAKSLRTLINSSKYPDISCGIKLTSGNIGYSNNIYTYPHFCAFLLKRLLKSNVI